MTISSRKKFPIKAIISFLWVWVPTVFLFVGTGWLMQAIYYYFTGSAGKEWVFFFLGFFVYSLFYNRIEKTKWKKLYDNIMGICTVIGLLLFAAYIF